MRIAAAIVFIVVGYGAAQMINDSELDQMKSEMAQMKALMFDKEGSASGRLQAVSNTMKLPEADSETIDALIEAMIFDEICMSEQKLLRLWSFLAVSLK